MALQELFGAKITPACQYCELAYPAQEQQLCSKTGKLVPQDYSCRQFRYDPIMRIPHRPLELEEFKAEDFAL